MVTEVERRRGCASHRVGKMDGGLEGRWGSLEA